MHYCHYYVSYGHMLWASERWRGKEEERKRVRKRMHGHEPKTEGKFQHLISQSETIKTDIYLSYTYLSLWLLFVCLFSRLFSFKKSCVWLCMCVCCMKLNAVMNFTCAFENSSMLIQHKNVDIVPFDSIRFNPNCYCFFLFNQFINGK